MTLYHKFFVVLCCGTTLGTHLLAQPTGKPVKASALAVQVTALLQGKVDSGKIPGAVVAIQQHGKIIYRQAVGYAQQYGFNGKPLQQPEPMTTEHLFDIASLTKVVGTTTAIMLLLDKGLLQVDDAVAKYIPAFAAPDKKEITIRHLLTHTAGLYEWYPLYYRATSKQQTYQLISELPLHFPVGKQRRYSDLGFTVLGQIVEKVSGLSLEVFVQQHIFIPLGMVHTGYNPLKNGFAKIAATSHGNPYEYRMVHDTSLGFVFKEIDPAQWNGWRQYTLKGEVNDGNAWYANGGVSGAAGLFSTIDDVQKLVDMLMNKGMVNGKQFISAETIQLFLTKDLFNNGLGWMMDADNAFMKYAPAGSFGHTGFTGTSIAVVPSKKLSVIILINRQNTGLSAKGEYYNTNAIRQQIFKLAMDNAL